MKTVYGIAARAPSLNLIPKMIKQIAAIRRKPELTRKEYLDQHYQVYGELSDIPKDLLLKPLYVISRLLGISLMKLVGNMSKSTFLTLLFHREKMVQSILMSSGLAEMIPLSFGTEINPILWVYLRATL